MKYTDEEMSRVLGEHAAGRLVIGGVGGWNRHGLYQCKPGRSTYPLGCANQAAYNKGNVCMAFMANALTGEAFDRSYRRDMSPEALIKLLDGANDER